MGQTQALEWNAEAYHRLSDMQFDLAMAFLDELELRGDETVVDAGCGSGRITRELLARLPRGRVIGVDLAAGMVELARRVVTPDDPQRARFVRADLQTFTLPRAADGIFSNMALHFVTDHDRLFANLAATLRPGGWLALQFGSTMRRQRAATHMMRAFVEPPFGKYLHGKAFAFRGSDAAGTERALHGAGFVDVVVQAMHSRMAPEQRAKMLQFFRTTTLPEALALLPSAALRAAFTERVDRHLDEAFTCDFDYLRVRARLPPLH